jgi:AhpD family alkylhydroperoxidase
MRRECGRMMLSRVEEIERNLDKISAFSPSLVKAWNRFNDVTEGSGALDPKHKELTSIALSIVEKCDWCIALHVKRALELGASKQEIIEAAWVAVMMDGGPALMYAQRVVEALEEFEEVQPKDEVYVGAGMDNKEVDMGFQQLYLKLLDYVGSICDESEAMCDENVDKIRLAKKIADTNSQKLESLVNEECDRRGWEELSEDPSFINLKGGES